MTQSTTRRNVTYRLLPGNRAKAQRLAALAGACRFVWNEMLDQQDQLHAIARMQGAKPPSVSFLTLGRRSPSAAARRRGSGSCPSRLSDLEAAAQRGNSCYNP
ncbi:MAG: helix-turn-helix domain-containing protein [Alphaproteobacteria bacterium]|nr:helix-turn-helix domain-containing protein [Alphaproteobacteria bacterium]